MPPLCPLTGRSPVSLDVVQVIRSASTLQRSLSQDRYIADDTLDLGGRAPIKHLADRRTVGDVDRDVQGLRRLLPRGPGSCQSLSGATSVESGAEIASHPRWNRCRSHYDSSLVPVAGDRTCKRRFRSTSEQGRYVKCPFGGLDEIVFVSCVVEKASECRRRPSSEGGLEPSTVDPQRAEYPNHVWSDDSVTDQTSDGKTLRFLTVIDEFTRRG